ncbi:flagellar protein FliT [Salinicola rhizosphaerae]|uniref:Flagellar protein FliT n=1 Tax=Salinicola rhizosphaerae TaxID=1443141 RepID=A0ABQ3DP90_9GAMM|nr:flagellar protein FliT [Salinicola rhizosphaerae]GHB10291.1 hypothetical protein GCM10009038_05080 [Salinicola rhizosphaerae]
MTNVSSVIDHYRALCELSWRMLRLAQADSWDELIDCEAEYVLELARIRERDRAQVLSDRDRLEKRALLETILTQDRETRQLLDARRDALSHLIGSSRRQQALGKAYHAGRGSIASRLRSIPPEERM